MNHKTKIKEQHTPFSDFKHALSKEIILWIELTYDRDSPLVLQYPDVAVRGNVAADRAGLDLEQLDMEDPEIMYLIHYYLTTVLNSNAWNLLITNQMVLDEYTQVCRNPLDLTDADKMIKATAIKTALLRDCDNISKRIEGYKAEIFAPEMEKEKSEGEKQVRITVEKQAANIREVKKKQQELNTLD